MRVGDRVVHPVYASELVVPYSVIDIEGVLGVSEIRVYACMLER